MTDEIVEVMARGVLLDVELTAGSTARSVLSALRDAGFVVVPMEPTAAMIEAGEEAAAWMDDATAIAYRAMIAAANPSQSPETTKPAADEGDERGIKA